MLRILAQESAPAATNLWVVFAVASIPAVASIIAAFLAARSERRTTAQANRAQEAIERERRLASHRAEVYKPFLEALQGIFDQINDPDAEPDVAELVRIVSDFSTWITIYGSDESIRAFGRFMQGAYGSTPPNVMLRHHYDLQMAARRDLGYPDTDITSLDLAALRLKTSTRMTSRRKLSSSRVRPSTNVKVGRHLGGRPNGRPRLQSGPLPPAADRA